MSAAEGLVKAARTELTLPLEGRSLPAIMRAALLLLLTVPLTGCLSLFNVSLPENHWEREVFTEALAVSEANAHAEFSLGRRLLYEGEYRAAIRHFERAVAHRPDLIEARIAIGRCWLNLGKPGRAADSLTPALALAPDSARALELMGQARFELGDVARAEALFEQAIAADSDAFLAWAKRGEIAYQRGNLTLARDHWRRAVATRPTDPQWRNSQSELAKLLADLERYLEIHSER